ncbi:TPA: hypothetical protein ACXNPR_001034 [Enterobacter cancerogenus]
MENNNNAEAKQMEGIIKTFEGAVKDKLFNKIYAYVLIAFLLINWQEIIILFKSKEDIYYTLAMVFTGQKYMLWGTEGIFFPAWFAHFGLPFVTGLFASVMAPYVTYLTSRVTSKWFAKIRREDGIADLAVEEEYQNHRLKVAQKTKDANNLAQEIERMFKENEILIARNNTLQERRTELFFGVKAMVDCYDEKKGLKTQSDVVDFLKSVEDSDFYKDQAIIRRINALIEDLKAIYFDDTFFAEDLTNK